MIIYQQSKATMGTDVLLTINSGRSLLKTETIFQRLWVEIEKFDKRFSRFRQDSEITQLNQNAGQWFVVSNELKDLLKVTLEMAKKTDGLFNPFILPALNRAGYISSWVPTELTANPPDYSTRQVVGYDQLEISGNKARIPGDSAIDVGGIGKGYLLQNLSMIVESKSELNYWFSLGGDIIARGVDARKQPWRIQVADSANPSNSVAEVKAPVDHAIAITTSGTTKRNGKQNGKSWHHIINPKTGEPANTDILTATLVNKNPVEADVYASCVVALGSIRYKKFLKDRQVDDSLVQFGETSDPEMILQGKVISRNV
jgi:FAD:protein FMN transferase